MSNKPILIWGAGAIGGVLGAYFAREGINVHMVDIVEEHVNAMNERGLTIEGPIDNFTQPLTAFTPEQLSDKYQCIILAVKAHHTLGALEMLLPYLAEDGYIISAQNGLNEKFIAERLGEERTLGCFVNFGADWLEPGRILYGNRAAVAIGELDGQISERAKYAHKLFTIVEPDTVLTDNIWGYLWGKLGYGSLLFCTALTPDSMSDAMAKPEHFEAYQALGHEVMKLATYYGVSPLGFNGFDTKAFLTKDRPAVQRSLDIMVGHNRKTAKTHSGIWRDLAVRKRQTEVDAQIGLLVEMGKTANLETPALAFIVSTIKDIEQQKVAQSSALVDQLVEELGISV